MLTDRQLIFCYLARSSRTSVGRQLGYQPGVSTLGVEGLEADAIAFRIRELRDPNGRGGEVPPLR